MCEHSPEIIPDRVSKRRRRNSFSPNYAEISQKLYAIPLQKSVQVDFDEIKYGMQYSLHHQSYSTREQFNFRYMVNVKPQKSLHERVRFTQEEVQILVQFHESIPNYRDFEDELMFNYTFLIELYHLKSKIKISVNGAILVMNKLEEFMDWLSQFEKKVMDEVEKKYQEFVTQYKNKRLEYDRENQQCSVRRGELKNIQIWYLKDYCGEDRDGLA
jgi:hypothetical protein